MPKSINVGDENYLATFQLYTHVLVNSHTCSAVRRTIPFRLFRKELIIPSHIFILAIRLEAIAIFSHIKFPISFSKDTC